MRTSVIASSPGSNSEPKFAFLAAPLFVALALVFWLGDQGLAQQSGSMTPPGMAAGAPAGSYALSGIENVNLFNGNLNFNLTLLKVGGRGRIGSTVNLAINSVKWNVLHVPRTSSDVHQPRIPAFLHEMDYEPFEFTVSRACVLEENTPYGPICRVEITQTNEPSLPQPLPIRFLNPLQRTIGYSFFPVARPDVGGNELTPGYGPGVVLGRYSSAREEFQHPDEGDPLSGDEHYHFVQSLYRLSFVAPDGTEHELVDTLTDGRPIYHSFAETVNRGRVFASTDGSAMTFISDDPLTDFSGDPTGNLFFADGTRCRVVGGLIIWIRDTNGNAIYYAYGSDSTNRSSYGRVTEITDTLGRKVTLSYADLDRIRNENIALFDEIRFNGVGGNLNRTIKVWHSQLGSVLRPDQTLKTVTELFPNTTRIPSPSQPDPEEFNPIVTSAVELPDGRKYSLKYNSYGELARAEMPTGAAIEYDFAGIMATVAINRHVTERRTSSDGVYWDSKQVFNPNSTGGQADDIGEWGTVATVETHDVKGGGDRLVSKEKHYFHGYPLLATRPELFYPAWLDGKEYKVERFDTSGMGTTVLRREDREWRQRTTPGWWGQPAIPPYSPGTLTSSNAPSRDPRVVTTTTTIEPAGANLVAKQTSVDPNDSTRVGFDEFNNRTELWEYDYGPPGQPGQLLRHTQTEYVKTGSLNGTPYDFACVYSSTCGQSVDIANVIHIRSLPQSISITDGVTSRLMSRNEFLYDEPGRVADDYGTLPADFPGWVSPMTPARGNLTTTRVWLDTLGTYQNPQAYLETHAQYDRFGNAIKRWDARGKFSEVKFASGYKYALPTEIFSADPDGPGPKTSLTSSSTYDFSSGVVLTTKDVNEKITSAEYNDPLNRLTKVNRPDGGWTSYEYGDTVGNLYLHTTTLRQTTPEGDKTLDGYQFFDGLGRVTRSTNRTGTNTWTASANEYDGEGRIVSVTNPYEASSYAGAVPGSALKTTTEYDTLGRAFKVTTPDGASVYTVFDGARTLVTDPAGKQRISRTDVMGRLLEIWEVTSGVGTESVTFPVPQGASIPAVSSGYRTNYSYDALGSLRKVEQGTQHRYFAYDSLARMIRLRNPEVEAGAAVLSTLTLGADLLSLLSDNNNNWSLKFEYDENGNIKKRTDARGIVTEYSYDDINRETFRNYSDTTPDVTYTYDTVANGKGRMSSVVSSASTFNYGSFDVMGRVTSSSQTTDGVTYSMPDYRYDKAGNLTSQQYPSGRIVATDFDAAGRLSGIRGQKSGEADKTYASQFGYAPHGGLAQMKLGNNLWEHTIFNSRLQPVLIGLGTSQSIEHSEDFDRFRVDYSYGGANNNGNVLQQTISVPDTSGNYVAQMTQSYTYDDLNRLKSAMENGGASWKQSMNYDRFGNRTLDVDPAKTTANALTSQLTIDPANNRFTSGQGSVHYDSGGNLDVDFNGHTFVYDAENRQTSYDGGAAVGGANYSYGADGQRIKKVIGVGSEATIFVYNAMGQLVAEYSGATQQSAGGTSYLTADHLGTPRIITDTSGAVNARKDYLPYGEEIGLLGGRTAPAGYVAHNVRQKFTQKERDVETGLDYFGARYYASAQGRFTTTDPNFATVESFLNPQRWNLYVYVNNNPLMATDPTGGDGEGQGGDKTITVILGMTLSERNTNESPKYGDIPAPDWQNTKSALSRHGYTLKLVGDNDITGERGLPLTPTMRREAFESGLRTSEVTIYVGHGVFNDPTGPEVAPYALQIGDTYYASDKSLSSLDSREGPKPEANSAVVANFSCNSFFKSDFFTFTGKGFQVTVTVDGGLDGGSALGTLEKAANAFVRVYASTNGTVRAKATAGALAAQAVFRASKPAREGNETIDDRRDKVVMTPVH